MMNRRQFTKLAGLSLCAVSAGKLNGFQKSPPTQIALTMDDFNWQNTIHQSAAVRNKSILETLNSHSLKTALFVIGRNIESDEGKQLLSAWNSAGHLLGNHTYSHQNLNAPTISTQVYNDDILRAEKLLTEFTGFKKYFRFPMLKEGDTVAKREQLVPGFKCIHEIGFQISRTDAPVAATVHADAITVRRLAELA